MRGVFPKADLRFVVQKEQLGTGHAVSMAKKTLADFDGDVLILYGDVPLLSHQTLRVFRRYHEKSKHTASVMTMIREDPTGYGRIVLDENEDLVKIVEEKDATWDEKDIREVNTGVVVADKKALFAALGKIKNDNKQGEYYLTDAMGLLAAKKNGVKPILTEDAFELTGINNRSDLAMVAAMMRADICEFWMEQGVTLVDPDSTYIDAQAVIANDTEIGPGCCLWGKTKIGKNCRLKAGCHLTDAVLAENVNCLPYTVIEDAKIGAGTQLGPFARIRPGTKVGSNNKIGNFVEMKKAKTGTNTKAGHLSYLGDADIGSDVNIGAGTITCNYDGVNKHKTVIGNGAFIGSDSQLVAPVKVGKGAYVGSGSTITKDVPADSLAVSRVKQFVKKGYAKKYKKKK